MIRVSVLYPAGPDTTFDHDYYGHKHVPLAVRTWDPVGWQIDTGLSGPYVAAVHFTFDSQADFDKAMALPGTADVMADVPNYTNVTPAMQISEISASS
jgi:uncharacterized protein (TIGR02118 family)